jgi:16S rRNA (guanine527-N7)-methyltransferase
MRRAGLDELAAGVRALGLQLDARRLHRLLDYIDLLGKWNRAYNLTAVREPAAMIGYHLLDSLSIAPFLHGPRLIDVGSGAGLPGLPLAIAFPAQGWTLLDANGKRTRFCTQAAGELSLDNVRVVRERAGDYRPARGFDTVVSRAFAALGEFAAAAGHLLAPGGRLVAMKGRLKRSELDALPAHFRIAAVKPLRVPGLAAERHLVEVERNEN